jgi:hypothetical protein
VIGLFRRTLLARIGINIDDLIFTLSQFRMPFFD